ncbi:MAG TPA: SPOR domain-containing protein [Methylomirabilota bacterium]|nr:SPOR domain-containing protein [Methylomirabilota bacterium]
MAGPARRRGGGGPGPVQWLALGGAVLVMMGLTFALGLLVGRQWARQSASAVVAAVAEPAKKPAAPARGGGIAAETTAERAPEPTLTFYHTLTEPLDGAGAPPKGEPKAVSVKIPPVIPPAPRAAAPVATAPPPPTAPRPPAAPPSLPPASKAAAARTADGGSAGAISGPPHQTTDSPKASREAGHGAGAGSPWTVQVGAYKNRRQADDARQHLSGAGLDAYVVTLAAQEGVARYRVRVGTYRTRDEAVAASERLRAQHALTTFVTPK